jgi:saccharopine dehydrogenase (NAD+, L-lysine-forming)
MKIGILKEGRTPVDRRAPLSPTQCRQLIERFPKARFIVQPSAARCFGDEEYDLKSILLDHNLNDCELLLGIKEVQINDLIPGKTYMFFSHTFKMQEHNKKLLKAVLEKNIRLIDYELLKDENNMRIIGFGHWAGIVGAYNGIRGYSIRYKLHEPKPAHTFDSYSEMICEAAKIKLPPIKIIVTGNGRVAHGVLQLLNALKIKKISSKEFLTDKKYDVPVYAQIDVDEYTKHKNGKPFDMKHFMANPQEYENNFLRFLPVTDMLISAAYWDTKAPVLFTADDMRKPEFRIRVIADITCDIKGSIPSTLRSAIIEDPFYGYNPFTEKEELAFTSPKNITMMAVDNLPCELPRDASEDFGKTLVEQVLPEFLTGDRQGILAKATIAENGKITSGFKYLEEWVKG